MFATLFAGSQLFGATTSSFSDTTATSGNTISAAADWTPASISATVVQKSEGGMVDKIRRSGTFYVYANVSDVGGGSVTASVTNIATAASAPMTAGSWTVAGATYNFRTALLTAKSTLNTQSYSLSVTANDGVNTPVNVSDTVSASTATFAPSAISTTNVVTGGKPLATDKMTFTFSSAPDPAMLYAGWDGTARSVTVTLADKSVYGMASDVIGITDANGNATSLGYVLTGGDYVDPGQSVNFTSSSIVLSGNTFVVTLGTPSNTSTLNTDSNNRTLTWTGQSGLFNQWGTPGAAVSVSSSSVRQF